MDESALNWRIDRLRGSRAIPGDKLENVAKNQIVRGVRSNCPGGESNLETPRLVVTTAQSQSCLQVGAELVKSWFDVCFLLRHQNGESNVKISDV